MSRDRNRKSNVRRFGGSAPSSLSSTRTKLCTMQASANQQDERERDLTGGTSTLRIRLTLALDVAVRLGRDASPRVILET